MPKLRVAFFGSRSHFSEAALRQLAATQEVVALVLPAARGTGLGAMLRRVAGRSRSPLESVAREQRVPIIVTPNGTNPELREQLRARRPDLLCVAIFPYRLPPSVVEAASLGAINAHPSLLPRHRGPLPLFWTYHSDDRETGVTIHHVAERLDAGDIILQQRFELRRGYPAAALDKDMAQRAAALLGEAVEQLARGNAARVQQDESLATSAPLIERGVPMVDFDAWDVERVWHFLAALCPEYREPLVDGRGAPIPYGRVDGFERVLSSARPGSAARSPEGWILNCRGGIIRLAKQLSFGP